MSGRIHDLITAENFAKWAEGRGWICQTTEPADGIGFGCAGAQFLQSLGFQRPLVGSTHFACEVPRGINPFHLLQDKHPRWLRKVVIAWDKGQRSGPALAKIARENA